MRRARKRPTIWGGSNEPCDTISDNLANAEVPGFKGSAATFAALTDGRTGMGTTFTGKHLLFEQGKLMKSGGPFDAAIDGVGFFTLKRPDGTFVYTRDGEFHRTPDGQLRTRTALRSWA